jgi:catechol 2,3-dioxygenase-like lactoylglutathione lyase family enzyme
MAIAASRVFHVNVNCSVLDRSLAFYRDALGLVPGARTTPAGPQPGEAFGLDVAQWDAFMMTGTDGMAAPVVDLLEWKVPRPAGRPPTSPSSHGFTTLHVTTPETTDEHVVRDPDGTLVHVRPGDAVTVTGVTLGSSDTERTLAFLVDVLGFAADGVRATDRAGAFAVELVESGARTDGDDASRANHLGIFRVALMTDDLARDYQTLCAAGVRCYSPPETLDMGPGLPELRALFFAGPDGATFELIETPRA